MIPIRDPAIERLDKLDGSSSTRCRQTVYRHGQGHTASNINWQSGDHLGLSPGNVNSLQLQRNGEPRSDLDGDAGRRLRKYSAGRGCACRGGPGLLADESRLAMAGGKDLDLPMQILLQIGRADLNLLPVHSLQLRYDLILDAVGRAAGSGCCVDHHGSIW